MITSEQRVNRRTGIYGSDAAAICGKSPWKTPMDVWLEKTGRIEPEDISNKPAVKAGNYLERAIIEWFEDEKQIPISFGSESYQHPQYEWMRGHIDALTMREVDDEHMGKVWVSGGVLEVKTTNAFNLDAWTDRVPDYYLLQLTHYMAVTGLPRGDMAVLIGGNDFRTFEFTRNLELENKLIAREKEFWEEYVLKDIAPPLQTEADAIALYPQSTGKEIVAPQGVMFHVEQYRRVKDEIDELEKAKKEHRDKICAYMGDADMLTDSQHTPLVTWRTTKGSQKFDEAKFARENEQVYLAYMVNKPGHRQLRLKGDK